MKIDNKDRRILFELDRDCRTSYGEIARQVNLTKAAVLARVRKLEKEGIIQDYLTIIDTMRLGYTTYDTYLKFHNTTPQKEEEIIKYLATHPKVWFLVQTTGAFDLAVMISTKSVNEYKYFWNNIYKEIHPHVKLVRTAILIEYTHYSRKYLVPDVKKPRLEITWGEVGNEDLDGIDTEVLKMLSLHARTPIVHIAKRVHLTPGAVRHRMKNLEKRGIIRGYSINLNIKKLGYHKYKVMVNLINLDNLDTISKWLRQHGNVTYYDSFIGGADVEFALEMDSFNHFLTFLQEFKQAFGNNVAEIMYTQPQHKHKATYFPH